MFARPLALGSQPSAPRGFTLVEMLVATALVMLIMLLFAQIFEGAVGTMRAQRGLMNNDQKARTLTTTLRGDLEQMTYRGSVGRGASVSIAGGPQQSGRGIVPLSAGDVPDARQRGYFAISENDPLDDADDVLSLTVFVEETLRNALVSHPNAAPFYGRAQAVAGAANRNQPDLDDGQLDGAAISRAAEVCYFLRGTNLYRRVMLIRDPLPSASPPFDTQPSLGATGTGGPITVFSTPYALTGDSFYHDFDFSGTRVWTASADGTVDDEATDAFRFHFHGLESLDNALGVSNVPLGIPTNRFGVYFRDAVPQEYLLDGTGAVALDPTTNAPLFIGRFTQEETSHFAFLWPGREPPPTLHPMRRTDLRFTVDGVVGVDSDNSGFVDSTEPRLNGARAGEDILATNVEAFDIEVWDPRFIEDPDANGTPGFQPFDPADDPNGNGIQDNGDWVDLGNAYGRGAFPQTIGAGLNPTWGNQNTGYGPRPLLAEAVDNRIFDTWHPSIGGVAPFRPLQVPPAAGVAWSAGGTPALGDVIFPDAATGNVTYGFVAVFISAAPNNFTGPRVPEWPREPGAIVRDGGVLWQCFDNRIGLERIRITIRFRDTGTGRGRQVTLVHSFVE